MGFKTQQNGDEMVENHDINVTPFVDVMLVLLIIVMVAAPLATVNVPVDLPSSSAEASPLPDNPLYLTIQEDLTVTIGEDIEISVERLTSELEMRFPDKTQRLYLRADKNLIYQDLLNVMNQLVAGGYSQIALVGLEQPSQDPQ
ncbi:biopolymer transporter ExbD [Vibrio sp. SCSIO 43132]|uniref:biopolymer transporter ExbD n=1 Tax=Vibrio sp. SCSIO 43132 TaxID=2779363 RepID=UPI001CA9E222|nr:biopolymer transporter ExbD [Vibrio sp. SCSIO 43132]UAB70349.1 biopolymer transporter ExbD [Vibrio sp. SCSIO 43132]